jgi:hypothetical protein
MKKMIKYVATILAAAVIGGFVLAPVALATHGTAPVSASTAANQAPAPAPFQTGVDPLVPSVAGANPTSPITLGWTGPFDSERIPAGPATRPLNAARTHAQPLP